MLLYTPILFFPEANVGSVYNIAPAYASTVGAVVSAVIAFPVLSFLASVKLFPATSYTVPAYDVIAICPLSPLATVYSYVILLLLTDLNVAILSVPVPNFNFNVVVAATTAFFVVPFTELYIFSLYSATIVTFCPAAYIPSFGLVTLMLDNVGAVVSAVTAFPVLSTFVSDKLFPATSYTVPVYDVIARAPLSPSAIVYLYVILSPFTLTNVAVFSVPFPNFNFNAVVSATTAFFVVPFIELYMFSLNVATIVISDPALYVSAVVVTFMCDNVGATVSAVIAFPVLSFLESDNLFPATSYTSPVYDVIASNPLSPLAIVYS